MGGAGGELWETHTVTTSAKILGHVSIVNVNHI